MLGCKSHPCRKRELGLGLAQAQVPRQVDRRTLALRHSRKHLDDEATGLRRLQHRSPGWDQDLGRALSALGPAVPLDAQAQLPGLLQGRRQARPGLLPDELPAVLLRQAWARER